MANTFTAPFAQTPKTLTAAISTPLGGPITESPTGTKPIVTAGPNGAVVTSISAMPRATATASSLVLFLVKASGDTSVRPIDSVLMPAYTQAATTAIPVTSFSSISNDNPMRLEAGDKLYVGAQAVSSAEIVFTAKWMDF